MVIFEDGKGAFKGRWRKERGNRIVTRLLFFLLSFLLLGCQVTRAYAYYGTRPRGMGGAYVAVSDDAWAVRYNPAGLSQLEKGHFSLTSLVDIARRDDMRPDDAIALAYPNDWGTWGVHYVHNRDKVKSWVGSACYIDDYTDHMYGLSYGKEILPHCSVGLTARGVTKKLESGQYGAATKNNYSDDYFAVDVGFLYQPFWWLSMGVLGQDLNKPTYTLQDTTYRYIRNWQPGIAIRPDRKTIIACDISDVTEKSRDTNRDVTNDLMIGIERWFGEYVALRGGVHHLTSHDETLEAYTGGLSIKFPVKGYKYLVEYAYIDRHEMDVELHLVGLGLVF